MPEESTPANRVCARISGTTATPPLRPRSADGGEDVPAGLGLVKHKVLVLSGKGGVGKSTVAVNLAVALSDPGRRIGLLDVDVHGPSVPRMLGLERSRVESDGQALLPVEAGLLRVMSIGFLLAGKDDAVIWRGPLKMGLVKQFLGDVRWGELDCLVVDCPPGTGDEPLSVVQLTPEADGAVIVTTPQEVALIDVRRCVTFCREVGLPVLGVIENMRGFACPACGAETPIFGSGGGEQMAQDLGVEFLGSVPIDPTIVHSGDAGQPRVSAQPGSAGSRSLARIAITIWERCKRDGS